MGIASILFALFIIIICVVYAVRTKLVDLMVIVLSVSFFLLIILGIIGVFIPSAFTKLSDLSLKASGTYERIQEIDQSLPKANIKETSNLIIDDIVGFFTGKISGQEEDDGFSEIGVGSDNKNLGLLEKNLYPSLVSTVAFIYRALAVLTSIIGLVVIVYLSYATTGITDVYRLKKRVTELEGRVAHLENSVFPPNPR